jgi:hypothetical protein
MPRGLSSRKMDTGKRGGGSRAPPTPTPQFASLMSAAILFCQLISDEDEANAESLDDPIQMFTQAKKQKIPQEARMEVLDTLAAIVDDFMQEIAEIGEDSEHADEIQLKEMLSELYGSVVSYLEYLYTIIEKEKRGKDGKLLSDYQFIKSTMNSM